MRYVKLVLKLLSISNFTMLGHMKNPGPCTPYIP